MRRSCPRGTAVRGQGVDRTTPRRPPRGRPGPAPPRDAGSSGPRRSRRAGSRSPPITISGSSIAAGRPPTRRWVRVAFSPQTTQIADSIVISSARASSVGHRPERPAREVRVQPAGDDVAAALAQRLHGAGQRAVEELRLLDPDQINVPLAREREDPDRLALGHQHRRVARLRPALRVLAGRPVVDVGAHEQDPALRDLGAAEQAEQLVGLARRHAAGDDVEPGIGAVEHVANLPAVRTVTHPQRPGPVP